MPLAIKIGSEVGSGTIPAGLPGGAGTPGGAAAPAVGAGWEIRVLAAPDFRTLLAIVPAKMVLGFQFAKQLKDVGSGTVTLSMDDPWWNSITLPNSQPGHYLLDYEHVWQIYQDGVPRFEFLGETITEQLADASEQRTVVITGPGTAATLKWAMAAPPGFPNSIRYKLDAISDGFSETDVNGNLVLDPGLWNAATPANRLSLNPSGSCRLMASPSTTFLGTTAYDATNTSVSAQVTPMTSPDPGGATLDGSQLTQMYIQSVANSGYYALIGLSGTAFYCQFGGPSGTYTKVIGTAAQYVSAMASNQNYQYWQISEKRLTADPHGPGTFTFYTSPDAQNWTKQWSVVHNWDASNVGLYFAAKYDVDNKEYATVTSINSNVTTSSLGGPLYYSKPIIGGVWLDQLAQAQARGTIPFITTGQLNSAHDSFGNAWTDSQSVQLANGTTLYDLLGGHTSMLNADWIMLPGFLLQVGIPTAVGKITLGTDRSKQVIFRDGYDSSSRVRTRARDNISNLYAVINADGRTITATDSSSITGYGQREAWLQAAQQVTTADLQAVATAADLQTANEVLSWTLQVTPWLPGRDIFNSYDVGDWVGLERPDFSAVDAVRVVAIAVQVAADGTETHELTLNSYIQWLVENLTYIQNKLGGGLIDVAGTTAIPNNPNNHTTPSVFSLTLGSLGNVTAGGPGAGNPLVYDPVTGQWVPAGTVNPDTGSGVGMSVGGSGGQVTIAGDGSAVTVSAPVAPPADTGATTPVAASTTTTPTGTTIKDSTGTIRVVLGQQLDGTVTVTNVNAPAPSTPDAPTVGAIASGLVVGWDGLLASAAPLSDFLWTEIHMSTTSGFTPSSSTLQSTMHAGGTYTISNLTPGTTYYVVLRALNTSRVASAATAQVSGVPLAASGGNHVTFAATAPSGPTTGDLWYDTSNGNEAHQWNGTSWVAYQWGKQAISFTAQQIGGVTVYFAATQPSSPNTGDLWYNTSAGNVLYEYNGTAWTQYQWGTGSYAAGSVTAAAIAANTITAAQIAAATITSTQIASGTITASNIASGTITATQIAAGTITATLLASGIVKAGIIDGTTVTGSTLQNSSSNPRTSINPDGSITITNGSAVVIFKVGPDGTMYWYTATGALLMQMQPGGTQLVYGAATGPQSWDFEGSTQSWTAIGTGTALADSATWSNTGVDSLQITSGGGGGGTGTLSYRATPAVTSSSSAVTSWSVTKQAGTAAGDWIFIYLFGANGSGVACSGFSVQTDPNGFGCLLYRLADGTEGSSFSITGIGTEKVTTLIATVAGAAATLDPASVAIPSSGGPSTSISIGGITLNNSNDWLLWFGANENGYGGASYAITPPSGFTSRAANGAQTANASVMLADKEGGVASGATGTQTGTTATASYYSGVMVGITPGVGTGWGASSPYFPVVPSTLQSMQCTVYTPTALSALNIGFNWYNGTTFLSTSAGDQGQVSTTAGSVTTLTITGASAPPNATQAKFFVQESAADASGVIMYVDTVQVAGGLAYSMSPTSGSDNYGNTYQQGLQFTGLPGLTNVVGVQDMYGDVLATIDGSGNISGQTLSAADDVLLAGESISGTLNSAASGTVNYGYVTANPWPASPLSSATTALFELDAQVIAGRIYEFVMYPTTIRAATAGTTVALALRYTTDGSQPSTTSALATYVGAIVNAANSGDCHPGLRCVFFPNASGIYRFLVCGLSSGATWYFTQDPFIRCVVNDLGANDNGQSSNNMTILGSGTVGGSSATAQNYTKTYNAVNCYAYQGSTGHQPNTLIASGGTIQQGGNYSNTYNGDSYSWILWPYSNMHSDISGATITSVKVKLVNTHTWYNSGGTCQIGTTNTTSFPSTTSQPGTIPNQVNKHFNEGQTLTFDVTSSWASQLSTLTSSLIAANSNDLLYYMKFAGMSSQLIVSYTK